MFLARYPQIYPKYYEFMIKSRSFYTKVIYFVGHVDEIESIAANCSVPIVSEDFLKPTENKEAVEEKNYDLLSDLVKQEELGKKPKKVKNKEPLTSGEKS